MLTGSTTKEESREATNRLTRGDVQGKEIKLCYVTVCSNLSCNQFSVFNQFV